MLLKFVIKKTAHAFAIVFTLLVLNATPALAASVATGYDQFAQHPTTAGSQTTTNNPSPSTFYPENTSGMSAVSSWLKTFINLFSAVIGVGAVIMIIFAGIQYSAARDNPQAIQAAKQKIYNVLIGLGAFIFLWAFMQWLIPGGAF
jgi:hypothetical protein